MERRSVDGSLPESVAVARNGERFLVSAIFEPLARELLRAAELEPADRVLDLACGTGIVARLACSRLEAPGFAVGLDLDLARLRVGQEERGSGSWLCRARAESLPYPAGSFSRVACQHGMMFFADLDAALREVHRVLRPGGRVVASAWRSIDENPGFLCLHRALETHLGTRAAEAASVPFRLPDPAAVERRLREAGFATTDARPVSFEIVFPSVEEFVVRSVRSTSLALVVPDDEALIAVARTAGEGLKRYAGTGALRLPAAAYLVRATKGRSAPPA